MTIYNKTLIASKGRILFKTTLYTNCKEIIFNVYSYDSINILI